MHAPQAPDSQRRFERKLAAPDFPCAGAKAALARGSLHFQAGGSLLSDAHDARLIEGLQRFAEEQPEDAVFVTHAILFPETPRLDEAAFEAALWSRVQALHALDRLRFDWDPTVSSDPQSPHFSLSLGGRAFFVIGLHPGASRSSRRFDTTALVFNLHSQFETLRDSGRYDKLRKTILERDAAYSGSPNEMLAVHGEQSEARQYSGREVSEDWRCPFAPGAGDGARAH